MCKASAAFGYMLAQWQSCRGDCSKSSLAKVASIKVAQVPTAVKFQGKIFSFCLNLSSYNVAAACALTAWRLTLDAGQYKLSCS